MLPCLVLGGGLGSRLGTETETIPKPLVSVAGTPFVVRQLRWLAGQGVHDVVYSIGHLGHLIRAELAGREDLGCSVRFVDEGERRLGTAGAVRLAVDEGAVAGAFFVLYGDSHLEIDLRSVADAFAQADDEALMTVFANAGAWDRSNVVLEGDRVVRYDKTEDDPAGAGMHHIDYGLSILRSRTVLEQVPPGQPADLADLFADLSAAGHLVGFEARNRFYEIGSPEGLAALRHHLEVEAR